MKNILSQLFGIMLGSLVLLTPAFAEDSYTFDPNHSYVQFHINHFGFSNPSGKWLFDGSLNLDQQKPQNSKVSIIIQTAKIDTGVAALDEHLRGKLFFDSAQYPTATFTSNKVTVTGKDTANVQGVLTIHGISKPVVLEVKLNKMGMNPITEKQSVGFTAKTQIKRSDFGMTTLLPDVGDDVKIDIEGEAAAGTPATPVTPAPIKQA